MQKRTQLAEARYRMGWSQEEAAEQVGVTRATFSQWERGIYDPYPIHVHRLCELFGKTAEELDLGSKRDEIGQKKRVEVEENMREVSLNDELFSVDRDDTILHHLSQAVAQSILQALSEPGLQDMSFLYRQLGKQNMDKTRRILFQIVSASSAALMGLSQDSKLSITSLLQDWGHMAFFEQQLAALWDVYHTGGTVQADYKLKMLLTTYEEGIVHKYASEVLCMSYQLQGSLYRDMMRYDDAHIFYKKAFEVARELNDDELMSAALARRGVTCIQQNKAKAAIEYLKEAYKLVKDRPLPCLSGYILQALSEAYAIAQQAYESEQNINTAQQVLISRGKYPERSHCQANTTAVTAQKGVNAAHLHDYTSAITLIDQGMESYNPTFVRGRARLKAQQSQAYYGLGDIYSCCKNATEAWILARDASSNRILAQLRKLQLELVASPWKKEANVIDLNWVMTTL